MAVQSVLRCVDGEVWWDLILEDSAASLDLLSACVLPICFLVDAGQVDQGRSIVQKARPAVLSCLVLAWLRLFRLVRREVRLLDFLASSVLVDPLPLRRLQPLHLAVILLDLAEVLDGLSFLLVALELLLELDLFTQVVVVLVRRCTELYVVLQSVEHVSVLCVWHRAGLQVWVVSEVHLLDQEPAAISVTVGPIVQVRVVCRFLSEIEGLQVFLGHYDLVLRYSKGSLAPCVDPNRAVGLADLLAQRRNVSTMVVAVLPVVDGLDRLVASEVLLIEHHTCFLSWLIFLLESLALALPLPLALSLSLAVIRVLQLELLAAERVDVLLGLVQIQGAITAADQLRPVLMI